MGLRCNSKRARRVWRAKKCARDRFIYFEAHEKKNWIEFQCLFHSLKNTTPTHYNNNNNPINAILFHRRRINLELSRKLDNRKT